MTGLENDMQSLNTMMAHKPTMRYIVVRRKIAREDGKVVNFEVSDEATIEKARERLSSYIDDYKKEFNIVISDWDKQMMISEDNKFEWPCVLGLYSVRVFDALDYTKESSSGYFWQFDENGIPVSCSANEKCEGTR